MLTLDDYFTKAWQMPFQGINKLHLLIVQAMKGG